MSAVANVAVNLDASGALAGLNRLGAAVDGLGGKIKGIGQSLTGLGGLAASLGAGAALSGFINAGIEADRTAKTIKALAGQYGETERVTRFATQAAEQFGLGQTTAAKSVADLYGRLRPMGVSLENIQTTFTGVNKAAALMNLTAADTEGVMLQLSQAMGSGALQGDELRSIMERLPAVGQAVAKVMGVTVGEIKGLGAAGQITTDVIIQAMQELQKLQPPPPDAFKLFQKTMEDLNTTIGTKLLPSFTPLVQKISELVSKILELGAAETVANSLMPLVEMATKLLEAFNQLPEGVQSFLIQLGAISGAVALIVVPLGIFLQALGSIIEVVAGVVGALKGLQIFSTVAGWLGGLTPAIESVLAILGTLGRVIAGLFTGPVGWVALLATAGIAIYAFRDEIGAAFQAIGKIFADGGKAFEAMFIDPIIYLTKFLYEEAVDIFNALGKALQKPFEVAANFVRDVVNQMLSGIGNAINSVIRAINSLISGANRALSSLKLPQIPLLPTVSLPRFAEGGYVSGPTMALIGEGGEGEYVVPESKATSFARQWLDQNGKGTIGTSNQMPSITIQTGPVMQQDGKLYVTLNDMEDALQNFASSLLSNNRTAGGRRFQGV